MKARITTPFPFAAFCALLLSPALAQSTLYWGGSTAVDGSPLPTNITDATGTWDDSTENWSNAFSPTVFDAWVSGSNANLGYFTDPANAIITVDGSKTISGMFASLAAAAGDNRFFQLNGAAADTTLSLTGSSANFLISSAASTRGVVIGANNAAGTQLTLGNGNATIVKDGAGSLTLGNGFSTSSNAFTGDVLIRSGVFNVASGTSFNGVTKFDFSGYRPSIVTINANGNEAFTGPQLRLNLAGVTDTSDRISDNATITLANRGTLDLFNGHASGVEDIGGIVINGTGFILNSQGTAGQSVYIDTLSRGTDGRGTAVVSVDGSDIPRHNLRITDATGLTTDTLLPWLSTHRAEWLMIDSGNENQITRVESIPVDVDLANWASTYNETSNLRFDGTAGTAVLNALTGNTTINSLGIRAGGTALTVPLGGNTLTVNAGAIGLAPSGNVAYIIGNGTIRTGEVSPGVNRDLYLNTGNSNTSRLVLDTVLTGAMDIYVTGISGVMFGPDAASAVVAPNNYTGTVYVNSGTLNVNKDAAVTGNVVVASGGGLVLNRAAGLASTSSVTLGRDALFSAGLSAATLNGIVTSNGGQILIANNGNGLTFGGSGTGFAFNGGIVTHNSSAAGRINLATNVGYAATSETQAVFQKVSTGNFTIHLNNGASSGNAERTFAIGNSTTLAAGKSEMLVDVPIANGGSGSATGSIRKTGDGVLELTANNTFSGGVIIDGGTLKLGRIKADAQSGLSGTFVGTGIEGHTLTFAAPITGTMAVGQLVTTDNINWISNGRQIAAIINDHQVILNGASTVGNIGSCALALGSTTITTTAANMANVRIGAVVTNNNLPAGTTIVSVDSVTTFTVSAAATATATNQTLSYSPAAASANITLGAVSRSGSLIGNVTVNAGGTLQLDDDSVMNFAPLGNGTTNAISGSGSILLNGDFAINLAGADPTPGNSWTLVNVATLTETFGANFNVQGFTKSGSEWTFGDYVFSETTGVLSIGTTPPPADNFASWAEDNGITGQPFDGDFDKDGISNGTEYALGLSPTVNSQPAGTLVGNTLTFTKGAEAIANGDVSWIIETSTDLGDIDDWTAAVTQAAGEPEAAELTISYVFTPGSPAKNFARLKVVQVVAP